MSVLKYRTVNSTKGPASSDGPHSRGEILSTDVGIEAVILTRSSSILLEVKFNLFHYKSHLRFTKKQERFSSSSSYTQKLT